MLTVEPLFT